MFKKSTMGRLAIVSFGLNFVSVALASLVRNYTFIIVGSLFMYLTYSYLTVSFIDFVEEKDENNI